MRMKKYLKFMFAICVLLVPFFIASNNTGEASAVQVPQAVQDMKDNYKKSVKDVKVSGMIEEINTRNGVYRACVYYPTGMDVNNLDKPLPVYFDIHGGGFVIGSLEQDDRLSRAISDTLNICVISMDYGLAPENPWPQGIEDVYDIVNYYVKNNDKYHIDVHNMAIGGHSAGGNIATVVAMMANETNDFAFKCQVLDYPPIDLAKNPYTKPIIDGAIPPNVSVLYNSCYCTSEQSVDPHCSPIFASDEELSKLPPTVMLVCEIDSLCDEGIDYAMRLAHNGVEVTVRKFMNARHGFTVHSEEEGKYGQQMIIEGLRKYLL